MILVLLCHLSFGVPQLGAVILVISQHPSTVVQGSDPDGGSGQVSVLVAGKMWAWRPPEEIRLKGDRWQLLTLLACKVDPVPLQETDRPRPSCFWQHVLISFWHWNLEDAADRTS